MLSAARSTLSRRTPRFTKAKLSSSKRPTQRSFCTPSSASTSPIAPATNAIYPTWHDRDLERAREVDLFSRLLKDRIIYLCGPINDHISSTVVAQLLLLDSEDAKTPIQMYIDSPGGHVSSGMAIYDTMQFINAPVVTTCVGQACSMASLLLAAGAPGQRRILPHSFVMVHQPSSGSQGFASDMERATDHVLRLKKILNAIYHKHTGQTLKKIRRDLDRDTWLSAEEALKWGLVDKIITKKEKTPAKIEDKAADKSESTTSSSESAEDKKKDL